MGTLLAEPLLNSAREKKESAEIETRFLSRHSPNFWAIQPGFLSSNRFSFPARIDFVDKPKVKT